MLRRIKEETGYALLTFPFTLFFFFYTCSTMAGIKRKAEMEIPIEDENDIMRIMPLGSGNEVGRSSILLEYKGKTILVSFFSIFYPCTMVYYHGKERKSVIRGVVKKGEKGRVCLFSLYIYLK